MRIGNALTRIAGYGRYRWLALANRTGLAALLATVGMAYPLLLGLVRVVELLGGLALAAGNGIVQRIASLDLVTDPEDHPTTPTEPRGALNAPVVTLHHEMETETTA
ncbi:MAG: hypothetical protein ACRDMV_18225 [Streptosporangiales bacterium]